MGQLRHAVRALSHRVSSMRVAGRNGDPRSSRIRPAVGDQAGSLTEKRNTSPEHDDDWIKISQYVSKLNPAILKDATEALKHEKWRGEGVSQPSFTDACVSRVSAISISCTSSKMADSVRILLASLHGLQGGQEEAQGIVCAGGVEMKVELMGAEWARSVRAWRGQPERARFESLECVAGGAAATSLEALRSECNTRGLASYTSSSVPVDALALNMNPGGGADAAPGGGILGQMSLAMRRDIDLLPLKFLVRLSDSVSATSSSRTPAYPPPRDPESVHTAPAKGREGAAATAEVRTIEIVVGAAWKDHGAIERFMDRVAGSGSRLSPGLWQLPAGPRLRLVPGDETGVKTVVMHVVDVEQVARALVAAGAKVLSFPGYHAVQIGGLDVRLSEQEEPAAFYSEVRWEVEEAGTLQTNGEGVSCVGAITHGVVQSVASGVLTKKGVNFSKTPWNV